jgi:hypothetical protein
MHYEPPNSEQIEALKKELGMDGNQMADLFGVADRRAFRRYTAKDAKDKNKRQISAYMLFFAMARLELSAEAIDRILARMRQAGATIDLDTAGDQESSQD